MSTEIYMEKAAAGAGTNGEKKSEARIDAATATAQREGDRRPCHSGGATSSQTKSRGLHRTPDDMAAKMDALHGRGRTATQAGATAVKAVPVVKANGGSSTDDVAAKMDALHGRGRTATQPGAVPVKAGTGSSDNVHGVTGTSSGMMGLKRSSDEVAAKMDSYHGRGPAETQTGIIPADAPAANAKDADTTNRSHVQRGLRRSAEERAAKDAARAAMLQIGPTHTTTDKQRNDDKGSLPSEGQCSKPSQPFQPGAQHVPGVDANVDAESAAQHGSRNAAVLRGLGKNRAGRQQIVSGSRQRDAPRPAPQTAIEWNSDDSQEDRRQEETVPDSHPNPVQNDQVDTIYRAPDHLSLGINEPSAVALQQTTPIHQLVEARAVTDESMMHVTQEAQQVDANELEHDLEQKAEKKRKEKQCKQVGGCIILCSCLVLAISLGAGLGIKRETAPTSAPSAVPTSAPTGVLDLLLEDLPEDTLVNINSGMETPQWKAWNWISNHQNISFLQEWRKKQLFAMATFYYAFEGDNWPPLIQERWLDDSLEECEWFTNGFGEFDSGGQYSEDIFTKHEDPCDSNGKFVSLWLTNLQIPPGLAPSIPPEIALLTSLFHIDLRGNNVNGSLSTWLPLPVLHKMSALDSLLITPHGGTLPSELFQLTALTLLNLPRCQISGTLPTEIGLADGLKELLLDENQLVGRIPTEVGQMTALTTLDLSSNQLVGSFPSEMVLLTAMRHLLLNDNDLSSQLATEFGLMTRLRTLSFPGNSLTGRLPSELGLLTKLRELNLHNNPFLLTIPTELGLLTSLRELDLSRNCLSGTILSELGCFTKLAKLRLSDNLLTGPIPSEVGCLAKLRQLELFDNLLTGTIPSEVGLLGLVPDNQIIPWLSWIYLHNNRLTGTLPNELRPTVDTRLHGNQFIGTVPQHLCSVLLCDCSAAESLAATCADLDVPGWPGRFPSPSADAHQDSILLNFQTNWPDFFVLWVYRDMANVIDPTNWTETIESLDPSAHGEFSDFLSDYLSAFLGYDSSLAANSLDSGMYGRGFYLFSNQLPVVPNTSYLLSSTFSKTHLDWMTLTTANHSVLYSIGREDFGNQDEYGILHNLIIEVGADGSIDVNSTIYYDW